MVFKLNEMINVPFKAVTRAGVPIEGATIPYTIRPPIGIPVSGDLTEIANGDYYVPVTPDITGVWIVDADYSAENYHDSVAFVVELGVETQLRNVTIVATGKVVAHEDNDDRTFVTDIEIGKDGFYNGHHVKFLSGDNAGQTRVIYYYSRGASLDPPADGDAISIDSSFKWNSAPGVGDDFVILSSIGDRVGNPRLYDLMNNGMFAGGSGSNSSIPAAVGPHSITSFGNDAICSCELVIRKSSLTTEFTAKIIIDPLEDENWETLVEVDSEDVEGDFVVLRFNLVNDGIFTLTRREAAGDAEMLWSMITYISGGNY